MVEKIEIKIGKYEITNFGKYANGKPSLWIQKEGEEGGQFPLEEVEKIIGEYFKEKF